jgi:molecular chaperone Hsp33
MADRIVRVLSPAHDLVALCCVGTDLAREARRRHGLAPSSAALLGQGLVAGLLLGSLQKGEATRVNVQVEGDGPGGGFFVDADTTGRVRGYVRHKTVNFPGLDRFHTRPLLGSAGYVSVLRDVDGEFYRGSVALETGDLSRDLEGYFAVSEQVPTTLQLEALPRAGDELGWVGGLLVQALPDGDADALQAARARLHAGLLHESLAGAGLSPFALCEAVLGGDRVELLADLPAAYFCPCTRERVTRALSVLSPADLFEMIHEEGRADVNCDFCGAKYEITRDELQRVLDAVDRHDAAETARGDGHTRH